MSEYLLVIVGIVDALANLGDVIGDEDLIMYALGGLGDEYEQFIQNVTSCDTEVSFEALQNHPL